MSTRSKNKSANSSEDYIIQPPNLEGLPMFNQIVDKEVGMEAAPVLTNNEQTDENNQVVIEEKVSDENNQVVIEEKVSDENNQVVIEEKVNRGAKSATDLSKEIQRYVVATTELTPFYKDKKLTLETLNSFQLALNGLTRDSIDKEAVLLNYFRQMRGTFEPSPKFPLICASYPYNGSRYFTPIQGTHRMLANMALISPNEIVTDGYGASYKAAESLPLASTEVEKGKDKGTAEPYNCSWHDLLALKQSFVQNFCGGNVTPEKLKNLPEYESWETTKLNELISNSKEEWLNRVEKYTLMPWICINCETIDEAKSIIIRLGALNQVHGKLESENDLLVRCLNLYLLLNPESQVALSAPKLQSLVGGVKSPAYYTRILAGCRRIQWMISTGVFEPQNTTNKKLPGCYLTSVIGRKVKNSQRIFYVEPVNKFKIIDNELKREFPEVFECKNSGREDGVGNPFAPLCDSLNCVVYSSRGSGNISKGIAKNILWDDLIPKISKSGKTTKSSKYTIVPLSNAQIAEIDKQDLSSKTSQQGNLGMISEEEFKKTESENRLKSKTKPLPGQTVNSPVTTDGLVTSQRTSPNEFAPGILRVAKIGDTVRTNDGDFKVVEISREGLIVDLNHQGDKAVYGMNEVIKIIPSSSGNEKLENLKVSSDEIESEMQEEDDLDILIKEENLDDWKEKDEMYETLVPSDIQAFVSLCIEVFDEAQEKKWSSENDSSELVKSMKRQIFEAVVSLRKLQQM